MPAPTGLAGELFAAFSRLAEKTRGNDTLLSCPNLSKAPNYGDVLRRFKAKTPHAPLGNLALARLAFRYLCNNVGHLAFLLVGRLYILLLGWKTPAGLHSGKALVIDTFALLPRLAKNGRYEEMYLPGMEAEARAAGADPVLFFRLYGSRNPVCLWKAFRVLAAAGNACTEMHLFTPADWWALVRHIAVYPREFLKLVRDLDFAPALSPEGQIRSALIHTAGQCILPGEARRLAGLRLGLLAKAPGGFGVVSWHENQVVNKAFVRGLRLAEAQTYTHVRVVGAQLFIWPPDLLNNHPDPAEADLAPDLTLVNGPALLPENSPTPYAVGPSLRYSRLFEPLPAASGGPHLLVLLSYHPDETRRILKLVLPYAEAGNPTAYKFHPADHPDNFSHLLPLSPRIVTGDLFPALANASAVFGSGSGSLAEACALGVPVLNAALPKDSPEPDLNYLPQEGPDCGRGVLWTDVLAPEDIPTACAALVEKAEEPEHRERVRRFRDLLFTRPEGERIRGDFGLYPR